MPEDIQIALWSAFLAALCGWGIVAAAQWQHKRDTARAKARADSKKLDDAIKVFRRWHD